MTTGCALRVLPRPASNRDGDRPHASLPTAALSTLSAARASAELARGDWTSACTHALSVIADADTDGTPTRIEALLVLGLAQARRRDRRCWHALDEALALADALDQLRSSAAVAAARAEAAWLEQRFVAVKLETEATYARALRVRDSWSAGELAVWRRRAGIPVHAQSWFRPLRRLELAGQATACAAGWERRGYRYEAAIVLACSDDEPLAREGLRLLQEIRAVASVATIRLRQQALAALAIPQRPHVPRRARAQTAANPWGLTARQLEVLQLMAEGLSNQQIAARLVVAPKTAEHHVGAVLGKLAVNNRAQAATEAIRLNLVDAPHTRSDARAFSHRTTGRAIA